MSFKKTLGPLFLAKNSYILRKNKTDEINLPTYNILKIEFSQGNDPFEMNRSFTKNLIILPHLSQLLFKHEALNHLRTKQGHEFNSSILCSLAVFTCNKLVPL